MLLWLQKGKIHKLTVFKLKIIVLSFFLHLICLFIALFINFNKPLKIEIKSRKFTVPLVFLPLQKTVPGALNAIKNNSVRRSSTISDAKLKVENKILKNLPKKNQNKNETANLKKTEIAKAKIHVNEMKNSVNLKNKKNIEKLKKEQIAKEQEKIERIEQAKIKEINEEEKILKQEVEKQKKAQEILKLEERENQIILDNKNITQAVEAPQIMQDEQIFIGRNDLDQLKVDELVRFEIENNWRPPTGLQKNLSCNIKVIIDINGKTQIQILKSSNSIAYDLSVKRSCMISTFPKELWGKEVILNFGDHD